MTENQSKPNQSAKPVHKYGDERVLVIPTLLFHELGYFQGFCAAPEKYLSTLLDPTYTTYRLRDEVEHDPSFKQLIPYCIFVCKGQVFHYRRGGGSGEGRLLSKRSVGVGGHISSVDQNGSGTPYEEGMWREIQEEIHLETRFRQRCVGLINDDLTDVGKVHLGVVHLFELEEPKVRPNEQSIIETGFAPPAELLEEREEFETWSQICLESLFGEGLVS